MLQEEAAADAATASASASGGGSIAMRLPVGFRFRPTDTELLDYYLFGRQQAGIPDPHSLIQDCDVYTYAPWELPSNDHDLFLCGREMYFFTHRHRAGNRVSRTAGCGVWHGHGKDIEIKRGNRVIGHKVQFTYKMFHGKVKKKTPWIMHEFRLKSSDDLVLCKIYKKKERSSLEDDLQEQLLPDDDMTGVTTGGLEEGGSWPPPSSSEMMLPMHGDLLRPAVGTGHEPSHMMVSMEEIEQALASPPSRSDVAADNALHGFANELESLLQGAQDGEDSLIDIDQFGSLREEAWDGLGDHPFSFDQFGRMETHLAVSHPQTSTSGFC